MRVRQDHLTESSDYHSVVPNCFTYDVFLSHSAKDKPVVRELAARLKGDGLSVWFDEWEIHAGDTIGIKIEKGLDESRTLVLIMSSAAFTSDWVTLERHTALFRDPKNTERRLIPVRLDDCEISDVLKQFRYVDFRLGGDAPYQELLTACAPNLDEASKASVQFCAAKNALTMTAGQHIFLSNLPTTSPEFFAREKEISFLDESWANPQANIVTLVSSGGVGKTALINHWLNRLQQEQYRGARRIYAENFYSRGPNETPRISADEFFVHALHWFGETAYDRRPAWEKGVRLAELVRREKVLLILDGLEPLQHPPGELQGRIKDQGVQALLKELARGNPGLCVITTRVVVGDLRNIHAPAVRQLDLENLSPESGAQLLRAFQIKGTENELQEASREFQGHALAVTLLGTYLSVAHEGEIRKRDHIRSLEDVPEAEGRHARRVMESYEKWLCDKPELEVLQLMGLFDHAADGEALQRLRRGPAIEGLTDRLCRQTDGDWKFCIKHLRDLRLLDGTEVKRGDILDCHPLVREHFGSLLHSRNLNAWTEAHGRLYDHFLSVPKKKLPETLDEMTPIFRAVVHGCLSGKIKEALELYYEKVQRDGDTNYCCKVLGAIGADLGVLSTFFEAPWRQPSKELDEKQQGALLNWAGYRLQAVGRLREASDSLQTALEVFKRRGSFRDAALVGYTLCQISLLLGELSEAAKFGWESVEVADKSRDGRSQDDTRCLLAHVLHQCGKSVEAEKLFREAEKIQCAHEPTSRFLYSLRGFFFCSLLMDQGKHADVYERAKRTLTRAEQKHWLLDIALDHLTIGRNAFFEWQSGRLKRPGVSEKHMDLAVQGLREAGAQHHLPRGLLARSKLYRATRRFEEAWRDLREIQEIAERGEMKLYLADFNIEAGWLALTEGRLVVARAHHATSAELVERMSYNRYHSEVKELGKRTVV